MSEQTPYPMDMDCSYPTETPDLPAYRLACMKARAGGEKSLADFCAEHGLLPGQVCGIADGMTPTPAERAALEKEAKP